MLTNESHVVRKERCPECARIGNDRSGDNLAVYSDGHCFCFKCGHSTGRKKVGEQVRRSASEIVLPSDVVAELPFEARAWLGQYSLARLDIQQNNIMWSEQWSRIVFPYFDDTGLIAWQGRYVGNDKTKAKWFSQGKIHEIIHPIKVRNREAVLVEDIVSAIKVSKIKGSIPIFGSSISSKQLLRLKTVVDKVWVYLDPDVRTKSVSIASLARLLGLEAYVIFSDKDPKEHTHEEIQEYLK